MAWLEIMLGRPAAAGCDQGQLLAHGDPVGAVRQRRLDEEVGGFQVDAEAAREMARRCAREEGMLVGISSGATLAAIAQKLPELPAGSRVLGFNYDTGERYLSIEGFLPN